ncbi:methyl-accepting chemotaxis protein [Spirochaeta isovalerica]|uniref:Methyl-accepting chemotaxis protein n=1 Tax=Spirochaeta isovalerica TaxID=150 RepID=A0A841REJ0_9SPIO|nr:HAMP domain-containing methyl-accepting chemotaxis protein [Spirochaeta isovalerica]MBB6481801.1 methyl-accepting chemotaxis protein [Spirochaeta isovalerica]
MKIKNKLLFLIFSLLASMIITVAVFLGFQQVVNVIEGEKAELLSLKDRVLNEQKELSFFLYNDVIILNQLDELNKAIAEKEVVLENVNKMKLLSSLNDKVATALRRIVLLDELQVEAQDKLRADIKELLNVADRVFSVKVQGISTTFTFNMALSDSFTGLEGYRDLNTIIYRTKTQISALYEALEGSQVTIEEQYDIIDEQIEYYTRLGYYISAGFAIIVMILSIVISFLIANRIAGSINILKKSLSVMASGDLTNEIRTTAKDEVGQLSQDMSQFQTGLNRSLKTIKEISNVNSEVKEELIATASETSSAAVEISANINSISTQMSSLDENISLSNKEALDIASYISELSDHINEQLVMVEQSTASITEMIASIANVSKLTLNNQSVIGELVDTANEGDLRLTETTGIIEDINSSVNDINNMAGIIQNISSQTNLLAMNAAIEAAHAGDQGKGFAVVADEIRKLAEASATNTKEISKTLKGIIGRIEDASRAGQSTRDAFNYINQKISTVSEALLTVSSSTDELNVGGQQILEAMSSLRDTSSLVKDKSDVVKTGSGSVNELMGSVSRISGIVTNAITEVNIGFNEVSDAVAGLKMLSDRIGEVGEQLISEVNHFRTDS